MGSAAKLTTYCPYCHRHTSLEGAHSIQEVHGRDAMVRAHAESKGRDAFICTCNYCDEFLLVIPPRYNGDPTIYPTPRALPTDIRVDEASRRALDEAKRCAMVQAWNASAAMARRAIQAAALKKGATPDKKLYAQIDELAERGLITKELAAWAHEVRFIGNDGAHPPDEATEDDAKDAMELAEQFLTHLYVTPAIAAERKAAREAAKAKKP